jgi:hypothetical protein
MPLRSRLIELTLSIQRIPYVWPGAPEADAARQDRGGTCASKHALLARELEAEGIASSPLLVVGKLVPPALASDPELSQGAHVIEVHECLTVETPWAGPLRVDITWDPPLLDRGFAGPRDWDGASDTALAIDATGPGWSVRRSELRAMKEALRSRVYSPEDRALRDRMLAALSDRVARLREDRARAASRVFVY